ncbi:MAG: sensor N-terminal transmembrane domain-containing protein [Rhodospirillales bacterium]|nr:sensor N-terminal transmembrane domain-containing protein [Rhodospirillales bacterium]
MSSSGSRRCTASDTATRSISVPDGAASQGTPRRASRPRWISPLMRRLLLVNALPLALLLAALLYLDQYQNGLLENEVAALREQARVYAGALAQSAVSNSGKQPSIDPLRARPLLWRLTEPTPDAEARLFGPDGTVIADSALGLAGTGKREKPAPAESIGLWRGAIDWLYDQIQALVPSPGTAATSAPGSGAAGSGAPGSGASGSGELRLASADNSREMPPYIRRAAGNRLLVTVAEPVRRDRQTVGIILLTREARGVDRTLFAIRTSILGLFALALALTVLLSWYLSLTIARPILRLANAATDMREGQGRTGSVPRALLTRHDEIGALAGALSDSAIALWHRMDATERFAADVAHEIKNPLSSIRSAIETLRRMDDPARRGQLLGIMADDVTRLDRLISDVSDASRVDAELSRAVTEPVDLAAMLRTLAELHEATAGPRDARLVLDLPEEGLVVRGVADRLVQVFRNLIGNAESFSPPEGRIVVRARIRDGMAEIAVEDEGPGIPEGKLEQIFDRFYSERPREERFGQHSGLGLAISRQIVEALHGTIVAENRAGPEGAVAGARFIVRLPLA